MKELPLPCSSTSTGRLAAMRHMLEVFCHQLSTMGACTRACTQWPATVAGQLTQVLRATKTPTSQSTALASPLQNGQGEAKRDPGTQDILCPFLA